MNSAVDYSRVMPSAADEPESQTAIVTTTFYDLMAAMQASVAPGEEYVVVPAVMHLLRTSRITWHGVKVRVKEHGPPR